MNHVTPSHGLSLVPRIASTVYFCRFAHTTVAVVEAVIHFVIGTEVFHGTHSTRTLVEMTPVFADTCRLGRAARRRRTRATRL